MSQSQSRRTEEVQAAILSNGNQTVEMPTKKIPDHDTIPSPSTECLLTHYPPTHPSTPTPYFTTTATHSASLASITTTGRLEVSPFETQLILYNRGLFSFNPPQFPHAHPPPCTLTSPLQHIQTHMRTHMFKTRRARRNICLCSVSLKGPTLSWNG